MRKLTAEVFETLKADIRNDEVPILFHGMLCKQSNSIINYGASLDESTQDKVNLFNLFFRQYNTILTLSGGISHLGKLSSSYLDVTSIQILIRSCHERYLALWYLSNNKIFPGASSDEELRFKWLCYKHAGLSDIDRNARLRAKVTGRELESDIVAQAKVRREILREVKSHPLYRTLDESTKRQIEDFGEWRIGSRKHLSWNELAVLSPLKSDAARWEYHTMSIYAHSGYAGLTLDILHDRNVSGMLAYLYILAALNIEVLDNIFPTSTDSFDSRDVACVQEFMDIARSWV